MKTTYVHFLPSGLKATCEINAKGQIKFYLPPKGQMTVEEIQEVKKWLRETEIEIMKGIENNEE